jgi:hypothetical protein
MNTITPDKQRLYFLWDYDLSDEEVRHVLHSGTPTEKAWLITRILEYARWEDIWRYLTVADIRQHFDHLRFRLPSSADSSLLALVSISS